MPKIEPKNLKGFRDFGPKEQTARQQMFARIQNVFERFGFLPMSTPVLEYKEILMGKYGEEERLIYQFKDKGERDVAMRFDLTVPLARYVAQNQNQLTFPFKRYQIAPVWRGENTQKGRLREFYQCDIDVVGTQSPIADAEVMAGICKALEAVGIKDYLLRVNDRKLLKDLSLEAIRELDKVEKIGPDGVVKNLEDKQVPKSEIEQVKIMLYETGTMTDPESMQNLIDLLTLQGVGADKIKYSPSIARGLDYYTGTVFEIILTDKPEFGSIAGGGRYDSLLDQFSDKSLPAVGGSIGIDRLFEALESMNLVKSDGLIKALVLNLPDNSPDDYVQLVAQLREAGINSELYYEAAKLDKQFKYAESKKVSFAVIMGEAEKQKNTVRVKNLQSRKEEEIKQTDLVKYLQMSSRT